MTPQELETRLAELEEKVAAEKKILDTLRLNLLDPALVTPGTLRFGGNTMQLDHYGAQILAKGTSRAAIFWFDDQFQPDPNSPTHPSTTPWCAVVGYVDKDVATPTGAVSMTGHGGTATAELKASTKDDTNDAAVIQSYVNVGSDIATVRHDMDGGRTFAQLLLSNTVLRVASFTSDPGTLGDGDVWYRSDTDKLYARINGATVELGGGSMPMPPIVNTESWNCLGTQLASAAVGAPVSATWPAANRAIYIPLLVTESITVTKLFWVNGATASGNVNMALYTSAFAQVSGTETGSTAQSGTNALQEVNIADTALSAGLYYMALVMDNTTGTMFRYAATGTRWGTAQEASAFDLPATATPALTASAFIPLCGIATRTLVA